MTDVPRWLSRLLLIPTLLVAVDASAQMTQRDGVRDFDSGRTEVALEVDESLGPARSGGVARRPAAEHRPGISPQPEALVPGGAGAVGVAISGDLAFVVHESGVLEIHDIKNPGAPRHLDDIDLRTPGRRIAPAGNHLYVACGPAGLEVVDVTGLVAPPPEPRADAPSTVGYPLAPARPPLGSIASITTPGPALDVAVSGTHALVTCGRAGLLVVDIEEPTLPRPVATIEIPGCAIGLAVDGDRALVACGRAGLAVVDIDPPASPRLLESIDTPGLAYDVAVTEDMALVAIGAHGVAIVDASQFASSSVRSSARSAAPRAGSRVVTIDIDGYATGISISGAVAIVAAGRAGCWALDLTGERQARVAGQRALPSITRDVAISGSIACVAAGRSGLQILDPASDLPAPIAVKGARSATGTGAAAGPLEPALGNESAAVSSAPPAGARETHDGGTLAAATRAGSGVQDPPRGHGRNSMNLGAIQVDVGGGWMLPLIDAPRSAYGSGRQVSVGVAAQFGTSGVWMTLDVSDIRASGNDFQRDPTFELAGIDYELIPITLGARANLVRSRSRPLGLYLGVGWQSILTRTHLPFSVVEHSSATGIVLEIRPEVVVARHWALWASQRISFVSNDASESPYRPSHLNHSASMIELGVGYRFGGREQAPAPGWSAAIEGEQLGARSTDRGSSSGSEP